MSESEKKKRFNYRKNREKWIFVQSVIIAVLAIAILISVLVAGQLEKTYYIGYTESGQIDYNVFLKENDFYDREYLEKDQSYVASLIDKIIANFGYEMNMEADDVNYRYSYSIASRLEIVDNTSGSAIFNSEKTLVSAENKVESSNNRLSINEIVVISYDEYNDLAENFLKTYGLTNTTSNIVLSLEVDVLSDCPSFTSGATQAYSSQLRIPLTTKTVNVKMTTALPDGETKMVACNRGVGSEVFKTTATVLGVVDILLVLLLIAFVYLTRTEDITYNARIKKILSHYKSYIQKISNMFDTSGYQVIRVNGFDEMLEIKDTIQAPILMYENEDKTCSKFIIPTDSKLLYLYEIKIEGYSEPEPQAKPEPSNATVVKPHITNLVRPVVKVVVNAPTAVQKEEPGAEIETVAEEPEIENEADSVGYEAQVVVSTEEEPEALVEEETLEDVAEEIVPEETTEEVCAEESGVDAIEVFWPERRYEHKTYRYDPDGNTVGEGDIVLVPTRDVASDKDIVREAEVSKGNHKVDPSSLNHPLKKIIGVVRRKAEQVFTAVITPADEEDK